MIKTQSEYLPLLGSSLLRVVAHDLILAHLSRDRRKLRNLALRHPRPIRPRSRGPELFLELGRAVLPHHPEALRPLPRRLLLQSTVETPTERLKSLLKYYPDYFLGRDVYKESGGLDDISGVCHGVVVSTGWVKLTSSGVREALHWHVTYDD
jgi:hypothetical protein